MNCTLRSLLHHKTVLQQSSVPFILSCSVHTPKSKNIKVASWNVAGFKAVMKKGFLDYVSKEEPDVLCLQETKIKEQEALSKLPPNFHSYFNTCLHNAGYSGVGLMSKEQPISLTRGIGKEEHDTEGRVLTAEYPHFYLVNTYVPNSGEKLQRLEYRIKKWDVDMLAYLKSLEKKKPVIWCGDLNVAHKPIDLKNPKTNKRTAGFTEEERESFTNILNSGFVDTFRHFYPDKLDAYTFWSQRAITARANNVGWRLDYFIVSKKLLPSIKDSTIRSSVLGSDHCPIILEVTVPA